MTDFYKSLGNVNDDEQNRLGLLQQKFNAAIGKGNDTQNTMINSYITANINRKKCYDECPQGWSDSTSTWRRKLAEDGAQTDAGAVDGFKDVIASCRAGCDLKWQGIVQNAQGTEGVDVGKTIGRYIGSDGDEHDITQCTDLSKYAPKVKMGGLCDSNDECDSNVCVNWGDRCGVVGGVLAAAGVGRCGLGMTKINGGTYGWGNTRNHMCKSNIEQLGMSKWPGVTQYIKYEGSWVRLDPDWGYPSAPKIANQKLENGEYIQDEQTALKACEAYGEYCLGFYTNGDGNFILQSAGGENPKQNWSQIASELLATNQAEQIEAFGGYSSDADNNKDKANKSQEIMYSSYGEAGFDDLNEKKYSNPTFPIADLRKKMKKMCLKKWSNMGDGTCGISNNDVRKSGNTGWNGSSDVPSFGCNLPGANKYSTDCDDVKYKEYTCWHVGEVPKGQQACKTIRGSDIPSCFASGGRPREVGCPTPAKMIVWIGRIGQSYFAKKSDIVSVMQQLSTEFPDVRLTDKAEMDDIIAKNLAECACGWYRTDVFNGTTWRNGTYGPGLIPITNGYPSNTKTSGGCGGGRQAMIGCGTTTNSWNRGKGGIYITMSATQEFVMGKLKGLGFRGNIVESHQQLLEKPPAPKKMAWGLGSRTATSSGKKIYSTEKPLDTRTTSWTNVPGELVQLSTGQKEVYGVNAQDYIYAHAKVPGQNNANGTKGWRRIPGRLKNISASNKDYVFGVNAQDYIYQCKKPCKGAWQRMEGGLKQISGGQKYVYGVNRNDSIYRARLPITNLRNPQWYKIPGGLKWINASNPYEIFGTNRNNQLYKCQKPCTGGWRKFGDTIKNVEVDSTNTLYAVAEQDTTWKKNMSPEGPWDEFNWGTTPGGQGASLISPEPFIGGMKREGYAPLEGDMITACNKSGTKGGRDALGANVVEGDILVQNRIKEKEAAANLVSMQKQIKHSINQLQGDNLKVAGAYKNQSLNLLKQLSSYENAKAELLKSGRELDTLDALKRDSYLRKSSEGMS